MLKITLNALNGFLYCAISDPRSVPSLASAPGSTGRIANVGIVTTDLKRKASEMASPAPTEAEELAALNKALTALGFTDDVKLERFLHVLMPRVIDQMASKHESTKRKVLEILSHVNKRLKAVPAMPLPLEDLTALYINEERPPTVRNFALIYVEQAHARAAPEARAAQILPLLKGISARPRQAADIICRLAITALAVPEKQVRTAVDDMEFMTNANDRAVFLRHALLYLMYQPNTVGHAPVAAPAPSPAEQAMRGVANVAGVPAPPTNNATESTAAPPQPPAAPPGMSPSSVERILGPNAPALSIKDLATRKLALLEFFHRAKDSTLPPAEALMHYLVAACDADHETSRRGEELLRRRCVWDTNRPTVDLEDGAIVTKLYRAFLGDPENVPVESRTIPASPALKLRLASLMCRSVAAANAFPYTVQAIFTGLYGVGTNLRLKSAAMELAVWVLRHATDAQLRQAAPLLFGGMIKLLDGETKGAAASGGLAAGGVASLRGFCYQALGQLATRQPSLVVGTPDLAARVFGALATEPEAVRPSVQDAARSLASAYKGCGGGVAMAIEGLLLSSIDASAQSGAAVTAAEAGGVGARRLVAAQWARDLFPFSHAPARYLCVVACGDGVTCEGFGGEGTGKKSWFYFNNWDIRAEYYFVTHARRISGSWVQYAGYFHSDGSNWRHLATFEVNTGGADWDLNGLYSFVEQWSPQDTDERRSALYGPSFVSDYGSADGGGAGCPSFYQMPSATYQHGTLENHMHVNAWAEAGAVGIQVSTEIESAVARACARAGAPTRAPTRARARPCT